MNKVLKRLFNNKRLMPHIHLPLQSGCDNVLKRMARRCKTKDFKSIVQKARDEISNFNITTDIIVGFPGETEDEWQESLKFINEVGFSHIHIFTYSKRQGTKASRLDNHIDNVTKKVRSKELHELTKLMRKKILNDEIGKEYFVLWESKDNDSNWSGYTEHYLRVELKNSQENVENTISKIKVTGISTDSNHCIVELI